MYRKIYVEKLQSLVSIAPGGRGPSLRDQIWSNHAIIPRIICVATQGSGSTSSFATGFMLLVLKNHKKWAA